jgi:hypothetical protein
MRACAHCAAPSPRSSRSPSSTPAPAHTCPACPPAGPRPPRAGPAEHRGAWLLRDGTMTASSGAPRNFRPPGGMLACGRNITLSFELPHLDDARVPLGARVVQRRELVGRAQPDLRAVPHEETHHARVAIERRGVDGREGAVARRRVDQRGVRRMELPKPPESPIARRHHVTHDVQVPHAVPLAEPWVLGLPPCGAVRIPSQPDHPTPAQRKWVTSRPERQATLFSCTASFGPLCSLAGGHRQASPS